jgi:hypothetical protein
MISLMQRAGQELVWDTSEGPDWKSVLRAGEAAVATLRFETESRAIGEWGDRSWVLQREGPLVRASIIVYPLGSSDPVATYEPGWTGGGLVVFQNGVKYCWNPSHIWSTTYCFRRESKAAAVCAALSPASRKGSPLRVCGEAAGQPETPILVLLSGFFAVMRLKRLMELAEV